MTRDFTLRPVAPEDLDQVLRVQALCYPPAMQEPGAVVRERIRVAAGTSLVACGPDGVCAYAFAYASLLGKVTRLDSVFVPAAQPDTLYVHDVAVAPEALGRGLAKALVGQLLQLARARGLAHSALVSVQDSARFWGALGYAPAAALDADARAALATYPDQASYLARRL